MRRGVVWVTLVGCGGLACGGLYERNPRESGTVDVAGNAGKAASGGAAAAGGFSGAVSGGGAGSVSGSGDMAGKTCAEQRDEYRQYYAEVMAEFDGFPCEVDEDCRSYYLRSPCDSTCRLITSAAHRGIIDRLNSFGGFNCSPDCYPNAKDCPSAPPVHCIDRLCQ